MGMYTELVFATRLKRDIPNNVHDVLLYMVGDDDACGEPPNHPLFDTTRWEFMLRCDSYYFDGDTHSEFNWDKIGEFYTLTVRCNLKNYSGEIGEFLDWLGPYVDSYPGEFHGTTRYEEDLHPTLIYWAADGFKVVKPWEIER